MSEESFIKTPKQLIWAVVLAFVVPIIVIIMLVNFVTSAKKPGAGSHAFTPEAVAERIAPVAKFELQAGVETAPAAEPAAVTPAMSGVAPVAPAVTAPAPAAAPAPVATVAAVDAGKAMYEKACMACHVAGVAGAPKFGDKAAWAPRIKLGVDALTASVIQGKGAMPARGAAAGASDADIKAAVQYLVNAAK
jgi:cytochrome c5